MNAARRTALIGFAGAAVTFFAACGQPPPSGTSGPPVNPDDDSLEFDFKQPPPSASLKDLGPDGRRVKVIVLPGDASVDVDGFTARRRDGVIELVGRLKEVRRLRVFKGTQQMEADVKIEQSGAVPPSLDLNTHPAGHGDFAEPTDSGPKKNPASLLPEQLE